LKSGDAGSAAPAAAVDAEAAAAAGACLLPPPPLAPAFFALAMVRPNSIEANE